MPNSAIPYIKWDKLRLIYRIKALEVYVRSLEKAFRPPANAEPAVAYMDKEKEELIKELLLRGRLLEEMSKLLGELKEENQSLHGQLEEAKKAEEVLRKPKKDSKTSSQPPSQDNKAKVTKSSGWGAKPGHQGFSYQPLPWDKVELIPLTTCLHTGANLSQQPVVAEPKSAAFARDIITMLLDAKKLADNDQREEKWAKRAKARLEKLIEKKLPEKQEEGIKIQYRLKKHKEEILLFLENPAVPFTNNATERAIRPVVVHRKVIQFFRTEYGVQAFATWYSQIDTFRKQGINIFEALKGIFDGIIPQLHFPQLE